MHVLHPIRRRRRAAAPPPTSNLAKAALFAAIVASLIGVFFILKPFLAPIVLALLLATVFGPMHRRIRARLPRWPNLAALLSVIVVTAVIIVPAGLFTAALAREGVTAFERTRAWIEEGRFRAMLIEWCTKLINYSSRNLLPLLSNIILQILNFGVMLFVMFYAFRDGGKMLAYVRQVVLLSASHGQMVLDRIKGITRAILLGTFVTAAAQAAVAFVGFLIVGLPGAFFWAVMLGAASMVPVVGTALVWMPAVLYLFLVGNTGSAVFLLVWCMAATAGGGQPGQHSETAPDEGAVRHVHSGRLLRHPRRRPPLRPHGHHLRPADLWRRRHASLHLPVRTPRHPRGAAPEVNLRAEG